MKRTLSAGLFLSALFAFWNCFAANVSFEFRDITNYPGMTIPVKLTPTNAPGVWNGSIILKDPKSYRTDTNGLLTITNLAPLSYTVEAGGGTNTYTITPFRITVPDTNTTLNVTGLFTVAVSPSSVTSGYSQSVADTRFYPLASNPSNYAAVTITNGTIPNLNGSGTNLTTRGLLALGSNVVSSASGGNARGAVANDFQVARIDATAVASGNFSSILGGSNNTASAGFSSVLWGLENRAIGFASMAAGDGSLANGNYAIAVGWDNIAISDLSVAFGGTDNQANGVNTYIFGGGSNIIDADSENSSALGADSGNIYLSSFATLVGGTHNSIKGNYTAILGGQLNTITNDGIMVIGNTINATNHYGIYLGYGTNFTLIGSNGNATVRGNVTSTKTNFGNYARFTNTLTAGVGSFANGQIGLSGDGSVFWANGNSTLDANGGITINAADLIVDGNISGIGQLVSLNVSGVSALTGGLTVTTNATPPANTTIIRAWVTITGAGGGTFKMPLYQ